MATLTLFSVSAAAEETITLSVVGGFPTSRTYTHYMKPFWEEKVPALTNGTVKGEVVSYTDLGIQGGEVVRMMSVGTLKAGLAMLGYVAGDDPIVEGVDLPGLTLDAATTRKAVEAYRPLLADLYREKYNIVPLAFFPGPMQVFYCATPISGLSDFKGKKIRVWSSGMGDFVAAAGGTPVTMSKDEVVSALQRHVIDCAVTGTMAGNQGKWYEVTTHYYPLAMGWSVWLLGANADAWSKLSDAQRKTLTGAIADLENEVWDDSAYETEQGSLCNVGSEECKLGEKGSMAMVDVSDADREMQTKIMEDAVLPKWAAACGEGCAQKWNDSVGKALGMTIR